MSLFTNSLKKKQSDIQKKKTKNLRDLIPVRNLRGGIVMTDDIAVTFLEVMPVNFKLKSAREQDYIINKYEELLKIIRTPFYIFTIAKKSDAKAHIDFIQGFFDREENENVRKMMSEYIANVSDISYKSAVRRRFIVALTYIPLPGVALSRVPFADIESDLARKAYQFKDAISDCGNDVFMPDEDSKNMFAAQIMMDILRVKASEKQRMVKLYADF